MINGTATQKVWVESNGGAVTKKGIKKKMPGNEQTPF